jgi:shikimate 5-dehydrogenase
MLQRAQKLGFRVLNGIPMVVNQGIAAFGWVYADRLTAPDDMATISSLMWAPLDL